MAEVRIPKREITWRVDIVQGREKEKDILLESMDRSEKFAEREYSIREAQEKLQSFRWIIESERGGLAEEAKEWTQIEWESRGSRYLQLMIDQATFVYGAGEIDVPFGIWEVTCRGNWIGDQLSVPGFTLLGWTERERDQIYTVELISTVASKD